MNYLVWQLIDSGFPSGGFAHSGGLEAAVQHGHVTDADSVRAFARQALAQAGRSALPLVTAAHRCQERLGRARPTVRRVSLKPRCEPREPRARPRAADQRCRGRFRGCDVASLEARVRIERTGAAITRRCSAGCSARSAIELADTQRASLHLGARRQLGSGPPRAHRRLRGTGTAGRADRAHRRDRFATAASSRPDDIAQTAPLIDLFQSTHDRLYSRLFQS